MEPRPAIKKPFLKWAGSKTKLVSSLKQYLPAGDYRYVEPFVGSGAAFLNADYRKSILCDSNSDLIDLYEALKAEPTKFIRECKRLFTAENNREERYYELRTEFNGIANGEERRASLFLYLNRHCYNGLCRYNSAGEFNTPFGRYDRPYFPENRMIAFAEKLQTAELRCQDFKTTFEEIQAGDVVYCDPPYVPLSKTANFTSYAKGGFSTVDHEKLAELSGLAPHKGVTVIISNHDTDQTRKLYAGAELVTVLVQRMISCDGDNRKKTKEVIAIFKDPKRIGKIHHLSVLEEGAVRWRSKLMGD